MSITLNSCQQAAVDTFLSFLLNPDQKELVLEGFAGTGKTTLVKYLIDNMEKFETAAEALGKKLDYVDDINVTATTHKAARVIASSLNTDPITIHSFLGLAVKNDFKTGGTYLERAKNPRDPSKCLLFIDEASMVDEELLQWIRGLAGNCKIVYMGDPAQLLNVKSDESPIFGDWLPTAKLTTVMRNEGAIEALSAQFRETVMSGEFQPIVVDGANVIHVDGPTFQHMIDEAFTKDFKPDVSAKVLAWTNIKVMDYNTYIADKRGITDRYVKGEWYITNKPIMTAKGEIIAGTDRKVRIQQVETTTEAGLEGYTIKVNDTEFFVPLHKYEERELLKKLAKTKDWTKYFNIKDTWGDLRPAYASTVHKSQGSTYDQVFIDLSDIGRCTNPDDVARLLYVAVSRASQKVILYGNLPDKYLGAENGQPELLLAGVS